VNHDYGFKLNQITVDRSEMGGFFVFVISYSAEKRANGARPALSISSICHA